MQTFDNFPVVLYKAKNHPDAPTCGVEIFGYLNKVIVIYRETWVSIVMTKSRIRLLPIMEFEEEFKEYKLLEQQQNENGG